MTLARSAARDSVASITHSASRLALTSERDGGRYLPFVDGLRAIAVLAVVGCHIGLPGFSGGYVGVDVFFVISGFLIINQIKDELEAGRFSFLAFYARRTLRIHPPFILMLLVVFLTVPFVIPTPGVFEDFSRSAVLSPIMLVNVAFYLKQGYFDISANEKPLLHTWTLAVEEQFYLVAPLLLFLVFLAGKRRFSSAAIMFGCALAAISFAGAITKTSTSGPNAAFYFMHWRMWEFIAGGLINARAVSILQRQHRSVSDAGAIAGLVCIVLAVTLFKNTTLFPSWRAALPVTGAALIIAAGLARPGNVVARLLSWRVMTFIGLVSYGWYLWHWPILSMMRIARLAEPSLLMDFIGGGFLAFAIACLSYRYVELPLRRLRRSGALSWAPGRIFAAGISAGVATALLGGAVSWAGNVWLTGHIESAYGVKTHGRSKSDCRITDFSTIPAHCLEGRVALLMGDSHAAAMFDGLAENASQSRVNLIFVGRGGCDPMYFAQSERLNHRAHACSELLAPFERLLAQKPPTVIITPAWVGNSNSTKLWREMFSQFDPSTRILLIAPAPLMGASSLACVVLSDRYFGNRNRCVQPRTQAEAVRAPIMDAVRSAAAPFPNVRIVDPADLFCDQTTCRPFIGDQVFYNDQSHLETTGVDRIVKAFAADFQWALQQDRQDRPAAR